jgi:hypothetical protein
MRDATGCFIAAAALNTPLRLLTRSPCHLKSPYCRDPEGLLRRHNFLTKGQEQTRLDNDVYRYLTSAACKVVSIDYHWVFGECSRLGAGFLRDAAGYQEPGRGSCRARYTKLPKLQKLVEFRKTFWRTFDVNRANPRVRAVLKPNVERED